MNILDVTIQNTPAELARLTALLERFSQEQSLPAGAAAALSLALHEHVSNILNYAFSVPGTHAIRVRVRREASWLQAEVEDDGLPFNPLDHLEAAIHLPLDAKPLGGLGIHIIRKSMDAVAYERSHGHNVLTLRKRIA